MKLVMNKAEYDKYLIENPNAPQRGSFDDHVEPKSYPCVVGYSVKSWQEQTIQTEIVYMNDVYKKLKALMDGQHE